MGMFEFILHFAIMSNDPSIFPSIVGEMFENNCLFVLLGGEMAIFGFDEGRKSHSRLVHMNWESTF